GERIVCPRAAVDANSSVGNDLWMVDAARGVATRYTFDGMNALSPVWSADGGRLIYASSREGVFTLFMRPSAGGSEPEFVARSAGLVMQCTDWSRDGRFELYQVDDARTSGDIWLLPMEGERK